MSEPSSQWRVVCDKTQSSQWVGDECVYARWFLKPQNPTLMASTWPAANLPSRGPAGPHWAMVYSAWQALSPLLLCLNIEHTYKDHVYESSAGFKQAIKDPETARKIPPLLGESGKQVLFSINQPQAWKWIAINCSGEGKSAADVLLFSSLVQLNKLIGGVHVWLCCKPHFLFLDITQVSVWARASFWG